MIYIICMITERHWVPVYEYGVSCPLYIAYWYNHRFVSGDKWWVINLASNGWSVRTIMHTCCCSSSYRNEPSTWRRVLLPHQKLHNNGTLCGCLLYHGSRVHSRYDGVLVVHHVYHISYIAPAILTIVFNIKNAQSEYVWILVDAWYKYAKGDPLGRRNAMQHVMQTGIYLWLVRSGLKQAPCVSLFGDISWWIPAASFEWRRNKHNAESRVTVISRNPLIRSNLSFGPVRLKPYHGFVRQRKSHILTDGEQGKFSYDQPRTGLKKWKYHILTDLEMGKFWHDKDLETDCGPVRVKKILNFHSMMCG